MAKRKEKVLTDTLVPASVIICHKQWTIKVIEPNPKTDWVGLSDFRTMTITLELDTEMGETLLHEIMEIILVEFGTAVDGTKDDSRMFRVYHYPGGQCDTYSQVVRELFYVLTNNTCNGQTLGKALSLL